MWQRPSVDLQLAAHLRGELERKRWSGQMPGVIRLARELGAARNTVESVLRELECEGLLVAQGRGKGRTIAAAGTAIDTRALRVLDLFFRHTPPTALVVEEAPPVTAILQFRMKRGLKVPEDFSLICTDPDSSLEWCQPSIANIWWDSRMMIRRIVRWTENLRVGREDRRKGFTKARFVEGETIGPAPAAKA